jgi:hypothetical protein
LALTQPWKDFVSKGLITELNVKFTPLGAQISCQVATSLKKEGDGPAELPIGEAKQRIIAANLWTPKGREKGSGPKEDLLPKKSLVKKDFEGGDQEKLARRAKAVALALTDTTARGRIGSLKLMHEGVDTFDKWWSGAEPKYKTRLLADSKHWKEFTPAEHLALAKALPECPFRGVVPTPSAEEDEDEGTGKPKPQAAKPEGSRTPPKKNGK